MNTSERKWKDMEGKDAKEKDKKWKEMEWLYKYYPTPQNGKVLFSTPLSSFPNSFEAWFEDFSTNDLYGKTSCCFLPFQLKWKERQWIQVKGSERKGHEQKLKHAHIQKLGLASTSSNNTVFTTTFINHFGLLGGSSLYLLTLSLALPHQFDLICPYGCTSVQSLLSRTSCNPIPNSSLTNLHKESGSWHSAKALRCIYMECGIQ